MSSLGSRKQMQRIFNLHRESQFQKVSESAETDCKTFEVK